MHFRSRRFRFRKLQLVQAAIRAQLLHQLLVRTNVCNGPILQYHDAIGAPYRGKPMSNHDHGAARRRLATLERQVAPGDPLPAELAALRWLVAEYGVQLFAQEQKTAVPVSAKRLATAFTAAGASLLNSSNLITKVYFPRLIIPTSAVIASVLELIISGGRGSNNYLPGGVGNY
jgi:hypothetical protein